MVARSFPIVVDRLLAQRYAMAFAPPRVDQEPAINVSSREAAHVDPVPPSATPCPVKQNKKKSQENTKRCEKPVLVNFILF
jgi:hypothetical protein